MGKGKKGRKNQDDDWEADLDEIAKEQGIEMKEDAEDTSQPQQQPKKKEKKKKKGKQQQDDSDDETRNLDIDNEPDEPVQMPASKKKGKGGGFAALAMDSEDEVDDVSEEEVVQVV